MNQTQPYMDVGHGHMSHSSVSSATSQPPHYAGYQQHTPLQNGVPSYVSSPVAYPGYGPYANGMQSIPHTVGPAAGHMGNQMIGPSSATLPGLATGSAGSMTDQHGARRPDETGQVAPPGMKPRVTATLWEDENSVCFQVEAEGVCVARREDNGMINGTKLLNVAGMTRGRRDGILKSEKNRTVVKIGPMHLKGVWIPFERALEFANKEKITEKLYPLFVNNINSLLYHPANSARQSVSGPALAAHERRREAQAEYMRMPQTSGPPSLQHHHSLANPTGAAQQTAHNAMMPHAASNRPGLDRAHTFPTPPTSASSVMGMGSTGGPYDWPGQAVPSAQPNQPLSIDTGLSNARSVPTTPASTPPANNMGAMSNYQTGTSYDAPRPMYSHSSQSSIGSQYGLQRYPANSGIKSEMGPPPRAIQDADDKRDIYGHAQEHAPSSDAADGEHEGDYTHSAGPYGHGRNAYGYHPHGAPSMMHQDQSHVSPDMTGSPTKVQGRSTPRSATAYGGYNVPQRPQQLPSSNLYNVMSENRPPTNDMYNAPYHQQSFGAPNAMKRGYEMDDDQDGMKRQKTIHDRNLAPMMAAQNKR